jgi:hypothetical protein
MDDGRDGRKRSSGIESSGEDGASSLCWRDDDMLFVMFQRDFEVNLSWNYAKIKSKTYLKRGWMMCCEIALGSYLWLLTSAWVKLDIKFIQMSFK